MSLLSISATVENIQATTDRLDEGGSQAWEKLQQAMQNAADDVYSEMRVEMEGQIDDSHGNIGRALYRKVDVDEGAKTVTATVGVGHHAFYGAILNAGVAKAFQVQSYSRRVKGLTIRENRKKIAQGIGVVAGYPRTLIIEPHPFIQASFRTLQEVITSDIEDSIRGALD